MTVRASVSPFDWAASSDATGHTTLADLRLGSPGKVVAVDLEDDLLRWLSAIGIGRGDRVTVLRAAPFGGPIHLRTHTGGEFAVDRALARSIHVEPERAQEQKGAA